MLYKSPVMKEVFCFCFCFDVSGGGGGGHWNGDGMGVSFLPFFAKGLWKLELCSEKRSVYFTLILILSRSISLTVNVDSPPESTQNCIGNVTVMQKKKKKRVWFKIGSTSTMRKYKIS